MIRLTLKLFLLLLPIPVLGCDSDSLLVRYLGAIQGMDWEAQALMLSEDARYYDPTMTFYDRPAIDLSGPDDIVDFWRRSSEESGTSRIKYTLSGCFETAGYHVFDYDILIDVSGAFWDVDQELISIPGRVMSVIRVKDGKIIEHIDYVDYAGTQRFVDELREQLGAAKD